MKIKLAIISVLGCMMTFLSSCLENDPYPVMYPTMGTITDLTSYSINSDSYGVLLPNNPNIISAKKADSIGQRVFINVTFPQEDNKEKVVSKKVNILELFKALTKDADDLRSDNTETIDKFGDAPIQIIPYETGAYISEEHLNLEFYIYGEDTNIPHRISLLLTEDTKIDDEGLLKVELRHDNFSDGKKEKFWGIASFTLSSIPECSDPNFRGFRIVYKNTDNSSAELKVIKRSDKSSIVRRMESSEEIGYRHTFFAGKLQ